MGACILYFIKIQKSFGKLVYSIYILFINILVFISADFRDKFSHAKCIKGEAVICKTCPENPSEIWMNNGNVFKDSHYTESIDKQDRMNNSEHKCKCQLEIKCSGLIYPKPTAHLKLN